jgi:hypothetical protein
MKETAVPDIDYEQSTRRLYWLTLTIGVTGTAVSWAVWGVSAGAGFGIGSAASLTNLWIWQMLAASLSGKPSRKSMIAGGLFAGRFLALFALGYVIVRALNVQPLAAILGLLVSSAAVVAEIVIELAAGRRLSR